ncbi:MAG TPA: c-type cytochrome domain-containing protein, partial [Planctomycetota bacterium]|nr:c-type cytochrome domain-containing protein [Planctomycetota bacterium]
MSVRRKTGLTLGLAEILGCSPVIAADPSPAAGREALADKTEITYIDQVKPLLATYCVKCHGGEKTKGDLNLANYKSGVQALNARSVWAKVADELHHGEMPPEKEKQPTTDERKVLTTWITSLRRLDPPD